METLVISHRQAGLLLPLVLLGSPRTVMLHMARNSSSLRIDSLLAKCLRFDSLPMDSPNSPSVTPKWQHSRGKSDI